MASQHKEGLVDSGQFIPYFYLAQAKYYHATKRFDKCLHNAYRASDLYDKMGMYSYKAEAMEIAVLALRDSGEVQQALDLSLEVNETLRQIRRN